VSGQSPNVALITGATGFIGRHLARRLAADGWRVHAVVRPQSNTDALLDYEAITTHVFDGHPETLQSLLQDTKPQVVFHLATHYVAAHTAEDIAPMVNANLLFGLNLLQAMKSIPDSVLVNAGTSWQVSDAPDHGPVNLYASIKQSFEDSVSYHAAAENLRAVTLRLFDVYGPDDPRGKLMSLLMRLARTEETLDMSPGRQLLDLVYVDDAVEGFIAAAIRARAMAAPGHEVYALSGADHRTLRDVAGAFENVSGARMNIAWGQRPYRAREVMAPWTDGVPLPGWTPRVRLEDGIERMLAADV
jgi:nucleoside-diphosphate-sugar epimerase